MNNRASLSLTYLSLSFLFSACNLQTADRSISLTWIIPAVQGFATAVAAAALGAKHVNSRNFDPDTSTFGLPQTVIEAASSMENRGVPIGIQNTESVREPLTLAQEMQNSTDYTTWILM